MMLNTITRYGLALGVFALAQSAWAVAIPAQCQPTRDTPDDDAVLTMAPGVQWAVTGYACTKTSKQQEASSYSAFLLSWSEKGQGKDTFFVADSLKQDNSGITATQISKLDAQSLVVNEMAERGGRLHIVWRRHAHDVLYFRQPYTGHDESSICSSAKDGMVRLVRCLSSDSGRTREFGPALFLLMDPERGFQVQNPEVMPTFTDWKQLPPLPK